MIAILAFTICGCAQTAEETPIAEPKTVESEDTEIEGEEATDAENAEKIVSEQEEQTKAAQKQWQVYIQPDMPEPFIKVLKQYEDFTNADVQDINDENVRAKLGDEWWYLYDELCMHGTEIRYSLTDLTGDGFPELIMGIYDDYFNKVYPKVVYYISPTEGIKMEFTSSYFSMDFYEGGIIEHISAGVNYTITYLQFQEETESWELADRIIVDWNSQDDSESYYWGVNTADFSDPANEPMSEEEYREIVERYTAEPVELEWIPLFGGETPDEKADSKNDEPVTVIAKVTHYFADESDIYWTEYEYDSAGNEIKKTGYNHDGSIDYWYESEYDNAGNRVKYICHRADGSINYWEEYEYDGAGNKMQSISYYADKGINCRDKYTYDSAGYLVEWIHYNADDSIFSMEEYAYDSTGNLTKTIGYNGHRDITRRIEYEYDNVGNLLGWIQYNSYDNDYDIRAKYEYDSAGKQTEFTSYDIDDNVVDWYEYKYDSKGNLTEEINCGDNGSTYFRTEYEYDSAGYLTKMTEYYLSHRIEHEYITITPQ